MKLVGQVGITAVSVSVISTDDPGAHRIWVRFGRFRLSLSTAEAIHIATELVDAVAQLRASQPTAQAERTV